MPAALPTLQRPSSTNSLAPTPNNAAHAHQNRAEMKIIFTTDENADHDALCDAIRGHTRGPKTDVAVVAPALNSRLRYWLSDEDDARRSAEARLQNCISSLTASGFTARGSIGDADPLQAIADSLAYAWADVLVVTTPRLERAHYLTKNLASRTRHHFGLPVLSLPLEENQRRE